MVYVAVVVKPKKIRICIDPVYLTNDSLYPIMTLEDVVTHVGQPKLFLTLDATSGYWHIPLSSASSKLCTIRTPFGRFRFNSWSVVYARLLRFIAYALAYYAREVLHSRNGVQVVMDIFVWGATEDEHDENLRNVLEKWREVNVRLNLKKCQCQLGKKEVE